MEARKRTLWEKVLWVGNCKAWMGNGIYHVLGYSPPIIMLLKDPTRRFSRKLNLP
jgi:hypothetical protein